MRPLVSLPYFRPHERGRGLALEVEESFKAPDTGDFYLFLSFHEFLRKPGADARVPLFRGGLAPAFTHALLRFGTAQRVGHLDGYDPFTRGRGSVGQLAFGCHPLDALQQTAGGKLDFEDSRGPSSLPPHPNGA